jgi:hypothetical protein
MILYAYGAVALIILALSGAVYTQSTRLEHCNDVHATFIANVDVERKEAEVIKEKMELDFKKLLGDKNAEYEKVKRDFDTTIDIMRKRRTSADSSIVPSASNGESTLVPKGQICFDQSIIDAAQRDSEAEIEEILFECGKANNQLTCAIDWIEALPKSNNSPLFTK